MKSALYTFFLFSLLLLFVSCEKLDFTEEENGKEEQTDKNSDGEGKDKADSDSSSDGSEDGEDGEDNVTNPEKSVTDTTFHGFGTFEAYLEAHVGWEAPIPVEDLLSTGCLYSIVKQKKTEQLNNGERWVEGYIVGYLKSNTMSSAMFTAAGAGETNILLATTPSETDYSRCIPVQLSNGNDLEKNARKYLNLAAYPDKLGRKCLLMGNLDTYMRVVGLKSTYHFRVYPAEESSEESDSEASAPDFNTNRL